MILTRFGFNVVVLVWLVPMLAIDVYGNTTTTGISSELYYYAAIFHGLLALFAGYQLTRKSELMTEAKAKSKVADPEDAVVSFKHLGAGEFVYCGVLAVSALVAWWCHHALNKDSTGAMSVVSLLWSWLDILIAGLAGFQFHKLKSGAIVQVAHKIFQQ